MEIKGQRFVSWTEAKAILLKKEKEKELGYEQKNALEHLRKYAKLSSKAMKEMEEELKAIEKLKEKHRVMIMNFLPQSEEELKLIFHNETTLISDEDRKKIVSIAKKFA